MKCWPQLLLGLVITIHSWPVVAQDSAEQWLQKMVTASHEASFKGRLVLLSGGRLISLAVFHAPIQGQVWERVVHLSGEPAEIIRQGDRTFSVHRMNSSQLSSHVSDAAPALKPPSGLSTAGSPVQKWESIQQGIQAASRYYRFELVGEDRVAGRPAILIEVEPLDLHRYGYTLWLDEESGVLLRSQTNPLKGDPLEIFEFVQLSLVDELSVGDFQAGENLKMPKPLSRSEAEQPLPISDIRWQAGWVPDGFVAAGRAALSRQYPTVSVRTYSDGLAAFTVFCEALDAPVTESTSSRGATVAVNRNRDKTLVTVVGEIPAVTAEKIAENVKILAVNERTR
ncbi:hypothetical protein FT643_21360 [Ketobacter sp. MCCC 1A13808]|uniref:MucB/RseB C-terminal domain-containing protein n=1 Tax=Ketobacter sp. MCCC 1A13808 TaxID=2602738 RepID=UPI000F21343D|nr:MucB/RseB C-terminal domain-containing protein [Ketobacter sp. MCCC 1A13808]MVF14691.1 hypothetical protein [Ketobacter sp. MCCC 1A13808]RLP53941.1 MAG: hypothetical protein D6160_12790 [Ketobacter sp.]